MCRSNFSRGAFLGGAFLGGAFLGGAFVRCGCYVGETQFFHTKPLMVVNQGVPER